MTRFKARASVISGLLIMVSTTVEAYMANEFNVDAEHLAGK
jgi:hypothetical protein